MVFIVGGGGGEGSVLLAVDSAFTWAKALGDGFLIGQHITKLTRTAKHLNIHQFTTTGEGGCLWRKIDDFGDTVRKSTGAPTMVRMTVGKDDGVYLFAGFFGDDRAQRLPTLEGFHGID